MCSCITRGFFLLFLWPRILHWLVGGVSLTLPLLVNVFCLRVGEEWSNEFDQFMKEHARDGHLATQRMEVEFAMVVPYCLGARRRRRSEAFCPAQRPRAWYARSQCHCRSGESLCHTFLFGECSNSESDLFGKGPPDGVTSTLHPTHLGGRILPQAYGKWALRRTSSGVHFSFCGQ